MAKKKDEVIEFSKGKTRKQEEKFFTRFSGLQLNAVLLFILADTFFVQGVIRYMELTQNILAVRSWLVLIMLSMLFFVFSVVFITVGGIVSPLKMKRAINMVSFGTFLLGVMIFLASLSFLLFIL